MKYVLMYSTFCYASKFGPPPSVYWQPVSHIWDKDWQHKSQPIWILKFNIIDVLLRNVAADVPGIFTCCVGWWCEVLKWLLMMLTHKCQNSRTMPLTKAFFLILYNETMSAIWHSAKLFICSESIFLIPFTSSLHSLKRERKQCPLPNLSNKSLVWLH